MGDPLEKITEGKDLLGQVRNALAGFLGYWDRENRREADKLLRETIARRYEEQWDRLSALQRELAGAGELALVGELEAAALKLRTFADRVKNAAYGYAGFFDAVRVKSDELEKIYAFDLAMLEGAEGIQRAVENIQASMGTDGLPAAIRHLTGLAQEAIDQFDRRSEIILTAGE